MSMRLKIRRRAGRRAALLAVGAMTAGLLLTAPQQATAGPPNLLTNPGFESAGTPGSDMPSCWSKSGWGDNDFTFATVADAHTGTKAMKVSLTRRVDGDRKALVTESTACAPAVTPGKQYDLSAWYKSNTPDVSVTVFRRDTTAGWQYWTDLQNPPVSAGWARTEVRTPPVPPNTDKIAWGLSVYGVGTLTSDDYTLEEVGAVPPQAGLLGHRRGVRQGQVAGDPRPEPGAFDARRGAQERQGAADHAARATTSPSSTRAPSPRPSTTRRTAASRRCPRRWTCSARVTCSCPTGGCW